MFFEEMSTTPWRDRSTMTRVWPAYSVCEMWKRRVGIDFGGRRRYSDTTTLLHTLGERLRYDKTFGHTRITITITTTNGKLRQQQKQHKEANQDFEILSFYCSVARIGGSLRYETILGRSHTTRTKAKIHQPEKLGKHFGEPSFLLWIILYASVFHWRKQCIVYHHWHDIQVKGHVLEQEVMSRRALVSIGECAEDTSTE